MIANHFEVELQKGETMAKPNSKAPLGQGGRFAAVAKAAGGGKKGAAIAAAAGRKKYGAAKMAKMAAAGKKKAK
jgi:hypothetical protein